VGSRSNEEQFVSYLLFADGTLFFCEANPNHLCHLHYLFLCFEINVVKSELVLVAVEDVEGLAHVLVVGFLLCQ